MLERTSDSAWPLPSSRATALLIVRGYLPVWVVLAAAYSVAFLVFFIRGIAVSPDTWLTITVVNLLALALVSAACWFGAPVIVRAVATVAVFIQMTAPLSFFSYAAVALGRANPLLDGHLARIDAAMGIDWLALVAWFNQHPLLIAALERAYHGTIVPVIFTLVLLALLGRTRAIIRFYLLFIGACLLCTALSAALPAVGAYVFFEPADAVRSAISADAGVWHLQHFKALRDGTFALFDVTATEGLVTFPSFHTAAALAIPLALRGLGPISGLAWAVAGVIIVSTVPIGGHYVIDVIAGGALALGLDLALRRAMRSAPARQRFPDLRLIPAWNPNRAGTH